MSQVGGERLDGLKLADTGYQSPTDQSKERIHLHSLAGWGDIGRIIYDSSPRMKGVDKLLRADLF